jgi:hypothetical protein
VATRLPSGENATAHTPDACARLCSTLRARGACAQGVHGVSSDGVPSAGGRSTTERGAQRHHRCTAACSGARRHAPPRLHVPELDCGVARRRRQQLLARCGSAAAAAAAGAPAHGVDLAVVLQHVQRRVGREGPHLRTNRPPPQRTRVWAAAGCSARWQLGSARRQLAARAAQGRTHTTLRCPCAHASSAAESHQTRTRAVRSSLHEASRRPVGSQRTELTWDTPAAAGAAAAGAAVPTG